MKRTFSSDIYYTVNKPYPPIKAENINMAYARDMLENIAGHSSEMTALSLYFYDHIITGGSSEISTIFHKVSMAEMRHLEIFASLARQLGEDPRLWSLKSGERVYWCASYDHYAMANETGSILLNAIHGERETIETYKEQANMIKDQNIVDNLERILLDEESHLDIFEKLYEKYI